MKKQLGILLLAFIATVGLSSAAAVTAQPVTQGPVQGPTYTHGTHGIPFFHWVIIRRFIVYSPFTIIRLRHIYPPPIYRVTAAYIRNHRYIVTVWRRVFTPIYK